MAIEVRDFARGDEDAVEAVVVAAFNNDAEAALVRRLRDTARPLVERVATDAGGVVGYILFTPVTLGADRDFPALGLAPMAVLPAHQRRGVGSALLHAGLEGCRKLGQRAVFVLGHPDYYPRFGFVPASRYGISSVYKVPDPAFMVLELEPGALAGKAGELYYHPAFDELP